MKMKFSQKTQHHKMIRKLRQNSPLSESWQTQRAGFEDSRKRGTPIKSHAWYECYVWVEPSADLSLAAARHRCGACEAQKRPAGPIVSRSPTSFVFNDVVGLDLLFLNTYEKHYFACHEHRVLEHWSATCYSPAGISRGEPLRNAYRMVADIRKGSHPCCRPAAQPCAQAFSRKKWKAMGRDSK